MTAGDEATSSLTTARVGGAALVVGALGFVAVFAYLAARFRYPEVHDGSAAEVLPALLATGSAGRAAWSFYALLPLIWIPAGIGAFHALRPAGEGSMRIAMHFATLSAISMMLGLMRWPSIHWELARAYVAAPAEQRLLFDGLFLGLNRYLGNFIGEFLGELSASLFFLLSAVAILRMRSSYRGWIGYLGVITAVAGMIGMFRNMTGLVAWVAEINNYLLPLWMIVFGVSLARTPRPNSTQQLSRPGAGPAAELPTASAS